MKKKNYRYSKHCKNCGKYIKLIDIDKHKLCKPKILFNKFLCGNCGRYKSYEEFGRDKTKKYGIRHNCYECRRVKGNGN